MGRCEHGIHRLADPGEHQQAVRTHPDRTFDVGVQAVPDDQGPLRARPGHRLGVQRRFRLARDDGRRARGALDDLQQRDEDAANGAVESNLFGH